MSARIKIYRPGEIAPDYTDLEANLAKKGFRLIAGVDEAGRGPLAGPVVAAAVIFPSKCTIKGICDSKKLNRKRREELFEEIIESDAVTAVGIMSHEEIDHFNILRASLMAMRKALSNLLQKPNFVLVDGNQMIPKIEIPQMPIIGGDAICLSISAASIIAKVTRDRIMDKYQEMYPQYTFGEHRGYSTPRHLEELKKFGPTEIHRKTFRPVEELLTKTLFD